MSLSEVVGEGDRRRSLVALRDHLARTLESAEVRTVAALARQLAAVLAELDALPLGDEESTVDELAQRRAERQSAANVFDGSAEGVVGGPGGG